MTLCRSWPLYGVLALALVVRAGWADDAPAKAKKAGCCSELKQSEKCEEKCCIEEAIQRLVQLGQLCNPSCDDNADCPKCSETAQKKRSLTIGIAVQPVGAVAGLPLPIPHVSLSCVAEPGKTAVCKPCPEGCPPCGEVCNPCAKPVADAKQYCVQTRWVMLRGGSPETLCAPKITVAEGERGRICIAQNAKEGCCQTPQFDLELQACSAGPNHARLKLLRPGFSYCRMTPNGRVVRYDTISAIESLVDLGKSCKLPLSASEDVENAKEWVEVRVNAIVAEPDESADCVHPCAATKAFAVACPPICPPAVAAVACRAPVCPPQACPVQCPPTCVMPPAVTAFHGVAGAPQHCGVPAPTHMFFVRAFRNQAGDLIVEPPSPAPMMPRFAVQSFEPIAALPMPVGVPMACPVSCAPATAQACPTPAIATCAVACPAENCKDDTKICIVTEDGESRLEVDCGNDRRMSFSDMRLKTADGSSLTFSIEDDRVQVSTTNVTASADHVRVSLEENRVVLEGNVKLTYRGKGMEGTAEVDKACINLKGAKVCVNVELSNESEE